MWHDKLTGQRLLALACLGWLLFDFRLLGLFDRAGEWFGWPALYWYVFAAWALFILLIGWVAEHARHLAQQSDTEQQGHAPRRE